MKAKALKITKKLVLNGTKGMPLIDCECANALFCRN